MQQLFSKAPIVPFLRGSQPEDALSLAKLMIEQGAQALEVCMTSQDAVEIIHCLSEAFPEILIGAGSVISCSVFEQVLESKAKFATSPGFLPQVVSLADIYSFPYLPGVSTLSDVMQANEMGLKYLKLFPVECIQSQRLLEYCSELFSDISFYPCGMADDGQLAKLLHQKNVFSVGLVLNSIHTPVGSETMDILRQTIQAANQFALQGVSA